MLLNDVENVPSAGGGAGVTGGSTLSLVGQHCRRGNDGQRAVSPPVPSGTGVSRTPLVLFLLCYGPSWYRLYRRGVCTVPRIIGALRPPRRHNPARPRSPNAGSEGGTTPKNAAAESEGGTSPSMPEEETSNINEDHNPYQHQTTFRLRQLFCQDFRRKDAPQMSHKTLSKKPPEHGSSDRTRMTFGLRMGR